MRPTDFPGVWPNELFITSRCSSNDLIRKPQLGGTSPKWERGSGEKRNIIRLEVLPRISGGITVLNVIDPGVGVTTLRDKLVVCDHDTGACSLWFATYE